MGAFFGGQLRGRGSAGTQVWIARTDSATRNNPEKSVFGRVLGFCEKAESPVALLPVALLPVALFEKCNGFRKLENGNSGPAMGQPVPWPQAGQGALAGGPGARLAAAKTGFWRNVGYFCRVGN